MLLIDARVEPLDRVVEACRIEAFAGGTIVFPNDTGYCMGCDPYCSPAVDRIYTAKARPDHKPLTLLVATPTEFLEYAPENPLALLASKRLLPGPVTLIVRRPSFVSAEVTAGHTTVGLRVPDEPLARAILDSAGPLAVASVEHNGEMSADLVIENGPTRYERESTIVDLTGRHARLVRQGVVTYEQLAELLGPIERQTVKVRSQA
jgi:L-threonylcarbamoyladenylate synthase